MYRLSTILFAGLLIAGCGETTTTEAPDTTNFQDEVQTFIDSYTKQYLELSYTSSKAEWKSNTMIVEGDTTNEAATKAANEALAMFTGSKDNIEMTTKFLESKDQLTDLLVRQLETILYAAANNPATVEDIVKERIAAETAQTKALYGFDFQIDGESVSTNDIDDILTTENDIVKRLAAWEASKEVGIGLKDGLVKLRDLRNKTVQALGYDDYFAYQVSEYGMTTNELISLMEQNLNDLWPYTVSCIPMQGMSLLRNME